MFVWDRKIQILRNCPALFSQLFIAISGVQGGSWGPPSKLCTRASKNVATPLSNNFHFRCSECKHIVTKTAEINKCYRLIINLIKRAPDKTSDLDPVPTWLVQVVIAPIFAPFFAHVFNVSLEKGYLPDSQKKCDLFIRDLTETISLDSDDLI